MRVGATTDLCYIWYACNAHTSTCTCRYNLHCVNDQATSKMPSVDSILYQLHGVVQNDVISAHAQYTFAAFFLNFFIILYLVRLLHIIYT